MTITRNRSAAEPPVVADNRAVRRIGILSLVGAALVLVGGQLHPRADTDLEFEAALAGMLDAGAWYPAHLLQLVAVSLIAVAFWMTLRSRIVEESTAMRLAVLVVLIATVVQAVELIPHTLGAVELDELRAGDATPLLDMHMIMQAFASPLLGLSVAALAVIDARNAPRWVWIPATLAVVGGVAAALAGPLLLATEDPKAGMLFIGYSGVGVWLLVLAVRRIRSARNAHAGGVAA